ncbi:hypothetical protein [Nocardioides caldifontis]|uniref:hypothetical protein n=1 Tax=Nocardioides caldifontis TaxID=2588938 RepID=UPI0013967EF4|nr:hypothetical protein [Nocardioides caldifontis]
MGVRNEAVRLSLIDDFSSGMAKAVAQTALLNRELNSLSGQSVVTARVSKNFARDTDSIARSANKADTSINQLTGRLRFMAQAAAALGPGLLPIGAVGIPAVTGLANQLGVAALAGGSLVLAFQGVGDALEAVNEASINPTAENLEKAREAMQQLSPATQDLVTRLQELRPAMQALRDASAEGAFPGIIAMFDSLETRGDEVTAIFHNIASAAGELAADAGADLASERWTAFFEFLATEAPRTLTTLGQTIGNLTHGLAELWMAFTPLNNDFSNWMLDASRSFDEWAAGLSQTEGFQEFVAYVRETGPQVAETFGAMAEAVIQIAQAAAPLGGPVLAGLEAVANVVATIADSDLGGPIMAGVLAWGVLTRAVESYKAVAASAFGQKFGRVVGSLTEVTTAQDRARQSAASLATQADRTSRSLSLIGKGLMAGGVLAALGLLDDAFDDLFNRDLDTSTLSRSLEAFAARGQVLGTIRDVWGADLAGLNNDLDTLDNNYVRFFDTLARPLPGDGTATEQAESNFRKLDEALASLVEGGNADQAAAIFDQLASKAAEGGNSATQLMGQLEQYGIALENAGDSASNVNVSSANAVEGMMEVSSAAQRARDRVAALNAAMEALSGFFDKRAAIRNYEAALDDFRKGLRETGRSFDVTTAKGRENQARLDAIGQSALQVAQNLTGIRRARFVDNVVGQLQQMASQLNGPAKQAVLDVIRELKNLGNQKPKPKVKVEGVPEAISSVNAVENALDRVDGDVATARIVTIRETRFTTSGSPNAAPIGGPVVGENANGGIYKDGLRTFADGGWGSDGRYYDRVPQIVRGGANILWAEQETGKEAYISAKRGMEERNIAILNEAASWFGLGLRRYANGGISGGSTSTIDNSRPVSVVNNFNGPTYDPFAVARAVEERQRDAVALMSV